MVRSRIIHENESTSANPLRPECGEMFILQLVLIAAIVIPVQYDGYGTAGRASGSLIPARFSARDHDEHGQPVAAALVARRRHNNSSSPKLASTMDEGPLPTTGPGTGTLLPPPGGMVPKF
jgi:hypothetical protein